MKLLRFDRYSLVFLILVVVVFPVTISIVYEWYFSKLSGLRFSPYIIVITLILASSLYLSVIKANMVFDGKNLRINHFVYSRSIKAMEVTEVNFYNELPENMVPKIRTNGIGIGRVCIGNFRLNELGKAFFVFSSAPVSVLKKDDETVIISTTKDLHEKILQWHDQRHDG